MSWLPGKATLFFLGIVGAGILVFVAFQNLRGSWLAREEEKNAREQESKKLKDMAEGFSRQLDELHKQLRQTGEGLPQNAAVPQQANKFAAEAAQALAKAKMEDFLTRAQEVKSTAVKLEKAATGWGPRVKEILEGEPGKKLANNKAQLEQLATLLEKERLSTEMAQSWSKQLKTLLDPVEAAVRAEDKFYSPPESLAQTIDGLAKNVRNRLQEYEADSKVLESLLAESQNNPAQEKTATQAIQDLVAEQEKQRLDLVAKARQAALDEAAKKIAAAEEKRVQAIAEMKLKQIDEATLAEKQQMEVFLDRMKAERERKALEARYEAALPEIKRNLQVFIAKGYAQPDGPARMMKTVKLEPVSLAGLRAAGALDEGTKGLQALLDLGSNFHNDRFKGNFPIQGVLTTKQIPILQQAQTLLRDFGPIMVEKGLLSP